MKPVFKIDGKDFSWILNEGSIVWSRNDLDAATSGRSELNHGIMYRKRIAVKRKLKISNCKRMTLAEMKSLNAALYPEKISVEFVDPIAGGSYTGTFYGSTVEATMQIYDRVADEIYWEGTTFSLTQA